MPSLKQSRCEEVVFGVRLDMVCVLCVLCSALCSLYLKQLQARGAVSIGNEAVPVSCVLAARHVDALDTPHLYGSAQLTIRGSFSPAKMDQLSGSRVNRNNATAEIWRQLMQIDFVNSEPR